MDNSYNYETVFSISITKTKYIQKRFIKQS